MSHSYTAQLCLNKSGKLSKKLYLCLQEKDGKFGPIVAEAVRKAMVRYPSVIVDCSSSGKMTRSNLENFAEKVLTVELGERNLLIQDSFSGQKDESIFTSVCPNSILDIKYIPPKTTKYIQPLDVYFFRQYKILIRRITDYVRTIADDPETKLRDRNVIIQINAQVHNQLSAPIYEPMLKYAWQKSGYSIAPPVEKFSNVLQVSFSHENGPCQIENCQEISFIVCAYCKQALCFDHFFVSSIHYH